MKLAETVTFGGGGLDRAEDLRRHPEILETLPARTLPLWRGKPLMNAARDGLAFMEGHGFAQMGEPVLLGRIDEAAIFARDVSALDVTGETDSLGAFLDDSEQTHPDLPDCAAFCELRRVMTHLTPLDAEMAATVVNFLR